LTRGELGSKNHPMAGFKTMIELMLIILRWIAGFFLGDDFFARRELLLVPVRADFDSRRGGCYPTSSPGVGWMTMRLDPVSWGYLLSQSASPRGSGAAWPWSVPYKGPQE
jgi:hypothetical protein